MMLPNDAVEYARTATFDENTVPEKLLKDHNLKAGAWGLLVVEEGSLELVFDSRTERIGAGQAAVIPPIELHHVRPLGAVRFYVIFHRLP